LQKIGKLQLFKSDTGDDRLPQNPVGGGVGKYDKVELNSSRIKVEVRNDIGFHLKKIRGHSHFFQAFPFETGKSAACSSIGLIACSRMEPIYP
ncbi:hypothetical protein, partial [Thiolapillus sp.]|uniref:hypothetical protein n=1 Tax=Thiolapillus sp. TaxID=2017437 RepID=UPI003AF7CCF9